MEDLNMNKARPAEEIKTLREEVRASAERVHEALIHPGLGPSSPFKRLYPLDIRRTEYKRLQSIHIPSRFILMTMLF